MHEEHLKISQLIDDELDSKQALKLFYQLQKDKQLEQTYRRYEAISQAMKTEVYLPLDDEFVSQVSLGLKNEPVYMLGRKPRYKKAFYTLSGVAASVALVAVVLVQSKNLNPQDVSDSLLLAKHDTQQKIATDQNPELPQQVALQETQPVQQSSENKSIQLIAGTRHTKSDFPEYYSRIKPVTPKINDYLQAHSGNMYSSGSNFQAYAQVAGYEQE